MPFRSPCVAVAALALAATMAPAGAQQPPPDAAQQMPCGPSLPDRLPRSSQKRAAGCRPEGSKVLL